jgi:transcription elongation factor GreB
MSDGAPVYITREGAKRLQDELSGLLWQQRPKIVQDVSDAAAQGDRSENAEYIYGKKKLREIDRRIHWLTISWRSPLGRILLKKRAGDTVTLRRPSGEVELTILSVRY